VNVDVVDDDAVGVPGPSSPIIPSRARTPLDVPCGRRCSPKFDVLDRQVVHVFRAGVHRNRVGRLPSYPPHPVDVRRLAVVVTPRVAADLEAVNASPPVQEASVQTAASKARCRSGPRRKRR